MSMAGYGTPSSQEIGGGNANSGAPRSVKRPRPVKSCIECRTRKLRCDRLLPCSQCQKSQRNCRYAADGVAADGEGGNSEGSDVEAATERAPKRINVQNGSTTSQSTLPSHNDPNKSRSLQVSASILDDYGARLERLEHVVLKSNSPSAGAFGKDFSSGHHHANPRRKIKLLASSCTIRGLAIKGTTRTRYFGQNSTRVLLNLFDEARAFMFHRTKTGDLKETFINIQRIHKSLQEEHRKALTPITVYVDSMTPIQKRMADILPKKSVCDQLIQVFLGGSETALYRTLHIPTFREQYDTYWEGHMPADSFLPQLLSILCIGYRFIGLGKGLYPDRDGIHLPTACALVRHWLDGLRGKQLIEFGTLQTEVLLLMAQRMINPKFQESWTRLGLVVRMAMSMGLHRDPSEFPQKVSPFWSELRRRIWYTLMELDLQMSMQCNMPACVRDGDYTTRPPQNLDDDDLDPDLHELPDGKSIDQPTDSQIQVYSASTLAYRFRAVDLINRIDSLTDFQEVLDCGNALERSFEDLRFILPRTPPENPADANRQWRIRTILDMTCRRTQLMLYRPFALSTPDAPHYILTAYLRSSVILLSYPDDLDTNAATYWHIWHMHYLILKQDILQAAFSVCYYIKHAAAKDSLPSPASSSLTKSSKAESIEEACILASESSALLSLPRLVNAVEKALEAMIKRIREIGTDLKDLVSLTVVLSICQGGTWAAKEERVKRGMRAIMEAGLQAGVQPGAKTMADPDSQTTFNLPIIPGPPNTMSMHSLHSPSGHSGSFLNPVPAQPFMMPHDIPHTIPGSEDLAMWDMEFWNPLLHGGPR
ncbi:uncharacterized protein BCR38DRAFT_478908 [Pseudomassariella vexata]|uniref:Zn(2)-C6 fungal-type domain-containing protein n=1 Tax=Pseudomassariella vexata TaxID=1141098 RepID=A0A1Y2DA56_9PEZI|nr:uncharacterized protein BCR38DRAFT_478908 [Pseudomassariella vexata]ORY56139.1 hypothetical protein BCR38DRAFT_478908 [Pseudomassariella vexata]